MGPLQLSLPPPWLKPLVTPRDVVYYSVHVYMV